MIRVCVSLLLWVLAAWGPASAETQPRPREAIAEHVVPPFSLGERINDKGVWQLLNSGGAEAGYVFETSVLAPLPGFSGGPINLLVTMDLEGTFQDVRLLHHNEPIFVSGLGEAPFFKFLEQYRGLSISQPMVVGSPYGTGGGGDLVYLDGVTKATASVRIAHETLLAAARAVAQEKMRGMSFRPPAHPRLDYDEPMTWDGALAQGLIGHVQVTNGEVQAQFAGTKWQFDDAGADPEALYLDLYVIDLGPPALARLALSADTLAELDALRQVAGTDEPILLIETARHGLVSDDFVRNTAPDLVEIAQDGLPVALRDADLFVTLSEAVPEALHDGVAMIFRTDRRLGFDPSRDWDLTLLATRHHGMFQPETGSVKLAMTHATPSRFFAVEEAPKPASPWRDALRNRAGDLAALAAALVVGVGGLGLAQSRLAGHPHFGLIRLGFLAAMLGFVGWYGQGQLSIVTPLAVLRTALDGGSLAFLLYDPFSLVIWAVTLLGFVLWGRGLFCGWLCPFGALQELADALGRALRLPQIEVPARWDRPLRGVKFVVLGALVAVVIVAPGAIDKAVEVEPFKTAITVHFVRDWYYVAYAGLWLGLGMMLFKGFCRYVCPLGALMVIGGMLRARHWIPRRDACGSPCQLCKVRCRYGAITPKGQIEYGACFQCLDCVTIHDDPDQCVPLILAAKRAERARRVAA